MILNAYQMMQDIRSSLNETTASHWTDLEILRKMNKAQRKLAMHTSMSGDWFMTKATVTPSSSLAALPSDCVKPIYIEDSNGIELPFSITVRERNQSRVTDSSLDSLGPDAYMYGEYIEINQDSYTGNITLWYEQRIPDLHFGLGATGSGSNVLIFQTNNIPVARDDYYNNSYVSITAGTGALTRALVTDYTGSTGSAVVAGTFDTTSVYGTETKLPIEAVPALTNMAIVELIAKPSAAIDPKYYEYIKLEAKEALNLYTDFISTRVKNTNRIRQSEGWQ